VSSNYNHSSGKETRGVQAAHSPWAYKQRDEQPALSVARTGIWTGCRSTHRLARPWLPNCTSSVASEYSMMAVMIQGRMHGPFACTSLSFALSSKKAGKEHSSLSTCSSCPSTVWYSLKLCRWYWKNWGSFANAAFVNILAHASSGNSSVKLGGRKMMILWALEALLYCTAVMNINQDKLHAPLYFTDQNGLEQPQDDPYRPTDESTLSVGGAACISEH
jgi:hypothetical protein